MAVFNPEQSQHLSRLFHRDIRRWAPSDDARLTTEYPHGLAACQDAFPNRSIPSILARAKRLGLSRAATGPKRPWLGTEETKLRRLWYAASKAEINAAIPGRSWPAITSKAGKLGLVARSHYARRPIPTDQANPIIQALARRLKDRGFTMADLDEVSGIGRNVSGRWFRPAARPSLGAVCRAIEALDGELYIKWK